MGAETLRPGFAAKASIRGGPVAWAVMATMSACGGGSATSPIDAVVDVAPRPDAAPDAPGCPNETCNGVCCASPSRACAQDAGPDCACPVDVVPSPFVPILAEMSTQINPPWLLGIGIFNGAGDVLHALIVAFDPVATPVDTDLVLPTEPFGEPPWVLVAYDVNVVAQTTRSTFFVSAGTLRLTRRCSDGVAGQIRGLVVSEQVDRDDPTPAVGGCRLVVPDLDFDYGSPCP